MTAEAIHYRIYAWLNPSRSVHYPHSPERVQARLSGRVILIFHYSTRSLLAAVRKTHGRNCRETNRPKRLRWGNPRQSTKANDLTDLRENTRPIQPLLGGEQTHLGHKVKSADISAVRQNSRSSQPMPGGEQTDLEDNPNFDFQH